MMKRRTTTIEVSSDLDYQVTFLRERDYATSFAGVLRRAVDEVYHARLELYRVELEQGAQSPLPQREE